MSTCSIDSTAIKTADYLLYVNVDYTGQYIYFANTVKDVKKILLDHGMLDVEDLSIEDGSIDLNKNVKINDYFKEDIHIFEINELGIKNCSI